MHRKKPDRKWTKMLIVIMSFTALCTYKFSTKSMLFYNQGKNGVLQGNIVRIVLVLPSKII